MWNNIYAGGTTPEGLCFEAIMDEIVPTSNDRDSFFLNFSDGMPMFSNNTISYYRDNGINHTQKMVKEIRSRGIKVLSYYVGSDYERESNIKDFKRMYGKDAEFVDVTNVMSVSKTMNKKFLEK
jgi:nitric oxide reductase activation protein